MFEEELLKRENQPLEEFNIYLEKLSKEITTKNDTMFQMYNILINKQMDIMHLNFILSRCRTNLFTSSITSLISKNLVSLLSTILLVKNGYTESTKIIFRNVYKDLLIGKMFAITRDYKLYENWNQGKQISIKKDIFMKLKNNFSKESIEFWDFLNKYNHGTIYSQDFILEYDKNITEDCNIFISVY